MTLQMRKKQLFFRSQFASYNNSQKSLFHFVDVFMDRDTSPALPPKDSIQQTVDEFNHYFQEKIENIRKGFQPSCSNEEPNKFIGNALNDFEPTTVE